MREQVLRGGSQYTVGTTVVLRQGLWAWMQLTAGTEDSGAPVPASVVGSIGTVCPSPPAGVRHELLAVWTDMVVGAISRQEVS